MDDRQARIAKNEATFRATNRELERASEEAGGTGDAVLEVLCECGKSGCSGLITLTVAEYDDAHSQKDRFVVLPGHENNEVERVVAVQSAYLVVEKTGEARATLERDHPQQRHRP